MDEPLSLPGDEVFLDAFWMLSTERYWATGPIPLTKIHSYAGRHFIEENMIGSFVRIVHKLDDHYLGLQRKEIERQRDLKKQNRGFGNFFRRDR